MIRHAAFLGSDHLVRMGDPTPLPGTTRSHRDISVQKPRWAFWKGLLTGAAIELPAIALTVWVVARLGIGNPGVGFMHVMRLSAVFAGVAALLTAGGIGRLAAYASVERGRRRAVISAMIAHAVAGAGLVVIAAIPHGGIDFARWTWIGLPIAGATTGAVCGAVIGIVCTGTAAVGLADVWSLTRRPSEALRHLLSPADLVRLGTALRTRTTTLFEGIFDPAPPPPQPPAAPPPAPAPQDGKDRKQAP